MYLRLNNLPLCVFLFQDAKGHGAFVGVVAGALCLFLAVFVLVCTETLSQRWRTLLGLAVWVTHLTMGFTFIFSAEQILPWDQVKHHYVLIHFYIPQMNPAGVTVDIKACNMANNMQFNSCQF